jgi:hypothetical protein
VGNNACQKRQLCIEEYGGFNSKDQISLLLVFVLLRQWRCFQNWELGWAAIHNRLRRGAAAAAAAQLNRRVTVGRWHTIGLANNTNCWCTSGRFCYPGCIHFLEPKVAPIRVVVSCCKRCRGTCGGCLSRGQGFFDWGKCWSGGGC